MAHLIFRIESAVVQSSAISATYATDTIAPKNGVSKIKIVLSNKGKSDDFFVLKLLESGEFAPGCSF